MAAIDILAASRDNTDSGFVKLVAGLISTTLLLGYIQFTDNTETALGQLIRWVVAAGVWFGSWYALRWIIGTT